MNFIKEQHTLISALLVFAIALVTYWFTLAPALTFVDSGELISAAHTLGVAHPPGTPLYTLLAHISTYFPIGNVAQRVGFLSALSAALASGAIVFAAAKMFVLPVDVGNANSEKAIAAEAFDREQIFLSTAPLIFCGLSLSFSRTLWAYATVAEVYALNTFLIVTVFVLVFWWRLDQATATSRTERFGKAAARGPVHVPSDLKLILAAFVFGLALGVHHVTVALTLVAIAFVVFKTRGVRLLTSKEFAYSVLAAVAGLCVYAYLPVAALLSPLMNWGDPRTFGRFWKHVSGWQYQAFFSFSLDTMAGQFSNFIDIAAVEFGAWGTPLISLLAVAGIHNLWQQDRTALWFLVLVTVADLVVALNYEIAEDKDAYYLPFFVVVTLAAAIGVRRLVSLLFMVRWRRAWVVTVSAFILVVVLETIFIGNLKVSDKSDYFLADDYVENIYRSMRPGSLLLTTDWQVYSPSLYKNIVEGTRPDLIIVDVNQMRRSWYFDYLDRVYPELMQACREKENAFLDDLRRWEINPSLYTADQSLARRIDVRFRDLISAMTAYHAGRNGSVYVSQEIGEILTSSAANRSRNPAFDPSSMGQDGVWISAIGESYGLVPEGLVFRLTKEKTIGPPVDVDVELRGLRGARLKYDSADVVNRKVVPVYMKMAMSRGLFAFTGGDPRRARREFESALEIDPSFAPAKQALGQLKDVSGKR